jgi:putative SOS response-associated peptidase YedK
MCFFSSQTKKAMEIARRYGRQPGIVEMAEQIIREQKIIKAYQHPDCLIVTPGVELQTAKWGLIPFWVRDVEKVESIRSMTANAKAETAFELPSFREAIKNAGA